MQSFKSLIAPIQKSICRGKLEGDFPKFDVGIRDSTTLNLISRFRGRGGSLKFKKKFRDSACICKFKDAEFNAIKRNE